MAKINSAKFTINGEIAKINSAKFAIFGAVNRENKFRENFCPKGNKYKNNILINKQINGKYILSPIMK